MERNWGAAVEDRLLNVLEIWATALPPSNAAGVIEWKLGVEADLLPGLDRLGQKEQEFEANMSHTVKPGLQTNQPVSGE